MHELLLDEAATPTRPIPVESIMFLIAQLDVELAMLMDQRQGEYIKIDPVSDILLDLRTSLKNLISK